MGLPGFFMRQAVCPKSWVSGRKLRISNSSLESQKKEKVSPPRLILVNLICLSGCRLYRYRLKSCRISFWMPCFILKAESRHAQILDTRQKIKNFKPFSRITAKGKSVSSQLAVNEFLCGCPVLSASDRISVHPARVWSSSECQLPDECQNLADVRLFCCSQPDAGQTKNSFSTSWKKFFIWNRINLCSRAAAVFQPCAASLAARCIFAGISWMENQFLLMCLCRLLLSKFLCLSEFRLYRYRPKPCRISTCP